MISDIGAGPQVHLHPGAASWAALVAARFSQLDDRGRMFRAELGLDPARPVVMSGHQPQFWHPGILAKLMALQSVVRRSRGEHRGGAQAVWLVVDHDETTTGVRYPVIDRSGSLAARTLAMDGGSGEASTSSAASRDETFSHVPLARRPATPSLNMPALASGERFGAPGVEPGLERIVEAMRRHAGEPNIARQIAKASLDCVCDDPAEMPTIVFATDIARTTLMRDILASMASEPERCVLAYNAAAAAHPSARVASLALGDDPELPIWRIAQAMGSTRRPARAAMLAGDRGATAIAAGEFVPRALLLTGMMRLAGCDLFIHGLGGGGSGGGAGAVDEGGYDAITTRWLRDWLNVQIGPLSVATATLRLRMTTDRPVITPFQVAHAQWLAHAAEHRPELLNDHDGAQQRASAVATLTQLRHRRDPTSRATKAAAYRDLHRTLEATRSRHSSELAAMRSAAEAAASRRSEAELLADRTWASPLYERAQIAELRSTIESAFGGA